MKEGQPFCDFSLQHGEIRPNPRQGLSLFLPSKERNNVQSQAMFIMISLSKTEKSDLILVLQSSVQFCTG